MQLDQNTTLVNALGAYMTKTVDVSNNQSQQELSKFARWCVGEYAGVNTHNMCQIHYMSQRR